MASESIAPSVTAGPARQFEYLDHTADVQFHAWGDNLREAFEQVVVCMFNYMTEIDSVEIDEALTQEFEITGHDMLSLLFNYMDEILFRFCADYFVVRQVSILEFDRENWRIRAQLKGELWDPKKHPQGTEIKAITYSNMQVHEKVGKCEVYVIVDI